MAIKKENDFEVFETHIEDSFQMERHKQHINNSLFQKIKFNVFNFIIFITIISIITLVAILTMKFINIKNVDENISTNNINITPAIDTTIEVREELLKLRTLYNNDEIIATLELNNEIFIIPQGANNNFYKNHNLYREHDELGTLYLNSMNIENDRNFIVYGNSFENSDFEFLKNYSDIDYFTNNSLIYTKDNKYNSTWQIFSYYTLDNSTLNILQRDFLDDDSFYITAVGYLNKSIHNIYDTSFINESDSLLTLCGEDENNNFYLHAKLVSKESYKK